MSVQGRTNQARIQRITLDQWRLFLIFLFKETSIKSDFLHIDMSYWINQLININYGLPCVSVLGAVLASSLEKSSREFLKFFNLATQRKI